MQDFLTSYNPNQDLNQLTEEELEKLRLQQLEDFYKSRMEQPKDTPSSEGMNNQLESVYGKLDSQLSNPNSTALNIL